MVDSADRDDELVAHSASERTRLGKGQVMRIGWHTAAYEAGLPEDKFPVVFIALSNGLAQSMDHVAMRPLGSGKVIRSPTEWRSRRGPVTVRTIADRGEPRLKPFLEYFGICCGQRVLGSHLPLRPKSRPVFDYPTNLNPTAAKW